MASSSSGGGGGGGGEDNEPCLVGFISTKIIGTRFRNVSIADREHVTLARQPENPYDGNSISVVNSDDAQVGHIDKAVAAVLSPLIDNKIVATVECIVPKPALKRVHDYPCQVHLYARPDAFQDVSAAIRDGGLDLIHKDHPEFVLSESAAAKEIKMKPVWYIDALFSNVEQEGKRRQIKPMEAPGDVVQPELLQHQKEALGWLVHREESDDLPPFWRECGREFVNDITQQRLKERPAPLRGGIFADDMGLGKTLTLLSLIGRSKVCNADAREGIQAKKRKVQREVPRTESRKTTLVVCKDSVFPAWQAQLAKHVKPGGLKVYLYHDKRTKDKNDLMEYDLVVTTLSTLRAEFELIYSPIKEIEWLRVIIDEAHVMKSPEALQTKAVISLKTERRWVVTGTPIQNSPSDLYPLISFLHLLPFSNESYWSKYIQEPLQNRDTAGLVRLQNLVSAISLRRTKDTVNIANLPGKTISVCYIDFSVEERRQYDEFEQEARNKMQELDGRNAILRNYSTLLYYFILRLRHLCNDAALWPSPAESLTDVSKSPQLLNKVLASIADDDCPICLSPPVKAVVTICGHMYCGDCVFKMLNSKHQCALCRGSLSKEDLFSAPMVDSRNEGGSNRHLSSKVETLLKLLKSSQEKEPGYKSVIFSHFGKMLIFLEKSLEAAGFKILRLDGSLKMKKRQKVIRKFANVEPGAPTVLLASLNTAGAGIDLTAASTVYLFDSWCDPWVELQAMDRLHRIGQTREVKVVRLIVKGTIEERIISVQERRKLLTANSQFGKKGDKYDKDMRLEELQMMIGPL